MELKLLRGLPRPQLTCLGCRVQLRGLQTVTCRSGVTGALRGEMGSEESQGLPSEASV